MRPGPDFPAFQPLYRQIQALITQSLMSGEWRPGQPIPSEIELATRFSVSQGTVRKAVCELAEERVLVRQQGRGTFVASHAAERSQVPFLRVTPDAGELTELTAELLDLKRIRDAASARLLGLNAGSSVFLLTRILKLNGVPACYEEVRLPASRFKGLTAAVVRQYECMLYSMYETRFGMRVLHAQEIIKAVAAPREVASLLGAPPGLPMMQIERLAFSYRHEPAELRRCLCDTRQHHYRNSITG
jgi:GntR family transcriptional regulator